MAGLQHRRVLKAGVSPKQVSPQPLDTERLCCTFPSAEKQQVGAITSEEGSFMPALRPHLAEASPHLGDVLPRPFLG